MRGGDSIGGRIGALRSLRIERADDAVGDERGIAGVVEMLELAPAAFREMTAGRLLMMRAGLDAAVVRSMSPGAANAAWRPSAVMPSPRAATRTIVLVAAQRATLR